MVSGADTEALAKAIAEDFRATSGCEPELKGKRATKLSLELDAAALLGTIAGAIAEEVAKYVSSRVRQRRRRELSEAEIRDIRELALGFAARSGMGGKSVVTADVAGKIADSVERVVRRHPEALVGRGDDG